MLLFLMLAEAQCDAKRPEICECLREEIEASYKNKTTQLLRMRMLMDYDELDCDKLAPLGLK